MNGMLRDMHQATVFTPPLESVPPFDLADMTNNTQEPLAASMFNTSFNSLSSALGTPISGSFTIPLRSTLDGSAGMLNPMSVLGPLGMYQPLNQQQSSFIKIVRQKSEKQREKERERAREKEMKYQAAMEAALGGPQGVSEGRPTPYISSQGCSRVFIVKILLIISNFVRGKRLPSIFTFDKDILQKWIEDARTACCSHTYREEEEYFGGCTFVYEDPATHWLIPGQLFSWWKNNLERKVKLKILEEDAAYTGMDPRRIARARWCETVIALARVIRTSASSTSTGQRFTTFTQLKSEFETKSEATVKIEAITDTSDTDIVPSAIATDAIHHKTDSSLLPTDEADQPELISTTLTIPIFTAIIDAPAVEVVETIKTETVVPQALVPSVSMEVLPMKTDVVTDTLVAEEQPESSLPLSLTSSDSVTQLYSGLVDVANQSVAVLTSNSSANIFPNFSIYPTSMTGQPSNLLDPTEQAHREAELIKPYPYMNNLPILHTWLTRHFITKCLDGDANINNLGFKNHLDSLGQLKELQELIAQGMVQDRFKDKGKDKITSSVVKERPEKKPRGRKLGSGDDGKRNEGDEGGEEGERVGETEGGVPTENVNWRSKKRGTYRKRRPKVEGEEGAVDDKDRDREIEGDDGEPKAKKRRGRPPLGHNPMNDLLTAMMLVEDEGGGTSGTEGNFEGENFLTSLKRYKSKAKDAPDSSEVRKRGGRGPGRKFKESRMEELERIARVNDEEDDEDEEEVSAIPNYNQRRAMKQPHSQNEYCLNLVRENGTLHFLMEFDSNTASSPALPETDASASALDTEPSSSLEAMPAMAELLNAVGSAIESGATTTTTATVTATTATTDTPSAHPAAWRVFGPLHSRLELGNLPISNLKWRSENQTKEYFSLFESTLNKDFLSPSKVEEIDTKTPKVGDKYQASLPALIDIDDNAKAKVDAKEAKAAIKTMIWSPATSSSSTLTNNSNRTNSKLFAVGTVLVMRYSVSEIDDHSSSLKLRQRLVCIIKQPSLSSSHAVSDKNKDSSSSMYTVYDGAKYCYADSKDLVTLYSTEDLDPDTTSHSTLQDPHWTLEEVEIMAEQIRQHSDCLRPVWLAVCDLANNQEADATMSGTTAAIALGTNPVKGRQITFAHVVDFYHRSYYLGKQNGGIKRLLALYRRADRARRGFPDSSSDEEEDDDDEEEDDEEDEDEEEEEDDEDNDDADHDDNENDDDDEDDGDDDDDDEDDEEDVQKVNQNEGSEQDHRKHHISVQAHTKPTAPSITSPPPSGRSSSRGVRKSYTNY